MRMSYEIGPEDFKKFEGKTKQNIAGGLMAIYPVVNSKVSQTFFTLQWMNPWSEGLPLAEMYEWWKKVELRSYNERQM